jgi:amino acid transporter
VLFFAHAKRGPSAAFHTNGVAGHGSYLWPFMISALMACYVMYGFDSAGELSEETRNPRKTAPRGILRAMLASGVGGALLLAGALLAAPSLVSPKLGTEGLAYVIQSRLGTGLGKVLLVGLFAIALLVVNLGQAALFTDITGVAVVVVYLAYLGVTVPRLVDRMKPDFAEREQAADAQFSLGRLGLPVNVIAVVFGAFFLVDIGWPRAVVYGSAWYLQYFSPIFAVGCAIVGVACYLRVRQRDQSLSVSPESPVRAQG